RVARLELDDGLLPARPRAAREAAALRLGLHLENVHAHDGDVEQLLDRLAYLRLVGVLVHLERVLVLGDLLVALLRDHGAEQHLRRMQAHPAALRSTASRAASLTSSERAHTTCATSSSDGSVTSTRWSFRKDFAGYNWPSA